MAETPLASWLRTEMPRRGYPIDGPRAGGIARLADEAEISRASMSRIVNGLAEPSIDNLRKIGTVLGYSFGEMLIHAGIAEPADLHLRDAPAEEDIERVGVPASVHLHDLEPWERDIWLNAGLTTPEKKVLILFIRLRRGVLDDDRGLLHLYYALGKVVERRLERDDPPQAV
jgi:transcriptional regulator with XRE-family HTH domain